MRRISDKELQRKYGGFGAAMAGGAPMGPGGWAAVISVVMQTVLTVMMSYKSITSDEGSLKYKGVESKWKSSSGSSSSSSNSGSKSTGRAHTGSQPIYIF